MLNLLEEPILIYYIYTFELNLNLPHLFKKKTLIYVYLFINRQWVGTMTDDEDQRKVVRAHGVKGRWDEAKLKALKDPIIVVDVGWQNLPRPWSYTLCSSFVRLCHIDKKWSLSRHETHRKSNYAQYTSCLDEHMKARMLEVYMAMRQNYFFPKNQVLMIVA